MQKFKGDDLENKMIACGQTILDNLSLQKELFFEGAYSTYPLGDLIYDDERSPLSRAMTQEIFRESFSSIFEAFIVAGTFESYILVFQAIFGADVDVEFTVPAEGKLHIDILAQGVELSNFVSRTISDNAYVYDEIIEELSGANIVFQSIKGFRTQYELEQMLFEMVPGGIYTVITLTLA